MPSTDVNEQRLSTDSDTAALWRTFQTAYDRLESGTSDLLALVIESDPDFALAHATAARLASFESATEFDPESAIATALAGEMQHAWEASHVAAVDVALRDGPWASIDVWRAHHDEHPADTVAMGHLIPHLAMSADAALIGESKGRISRSLDVIGEHAPLLGHLAMESADRLDLAEAEILARRSLELDPSGLVGGHPLAHVHFESGEHDAGVQWLDQWLPTTDHQAAFHQHLVWHAALHDLARGDDDSALDRYRSCGAPDAGGRLFDGSSLLWRCQLQGITDPGSDPMVPPIAATATNMIEEVPTVAVAYHVALGLATANDVEALHRLAASAVGSDAPGAEIVPSIAVGLAAFISGDHAVAIDHLLAVEAHADRLGGSLAQRQVFEDTLIEAQIRAGRGEEAATRLRRRLERRPHPRDRSRLDLVEHADPGPPRSP